MFLHDALYDLFDTYSSTMNAWLPWYDRIVEYYTHQQAIVSVEENRAIRRLHTVKLLYYELQREPLQAFTELYLRWSEIAIIGYEFGFDMQLHNELLRFYQLPLNRRRAQHNGLTQEGIDRSSALRWIKRVLIQSDYSTAIQVAEEIIDCGPHLKLLDNALPITRSLTGAIRDYAERLFAEAGNHFWGQLLTLYAEASSYSGVSYEHVRIVFEKAIELLTEAGGSNGAADSWMVSRSLGQAFDRLGYLNRSHGHYGLSLQYYRRALAQYSSSDLGDERANTMNNMALVLALVGETKEAKKYVDDGLSLRLRLGQQFPIALSYNTRGRILALDEYEILLQRNEEALSSRFQWAYEDCRQALTIFDELRTQRGIGLACIALGFVLRKNLQWLNRYDGRTKINSVEKSADMLFREGDRFLNRAAEIFQGTSSEPMRLWEAYNELGSLHRDWADVIWRIGGTSVSEQHYELALDNHLRALNIAQQYRLQFQVVDTYDDLAYVMACKGQLESAKWYSQEIIKLVPEEFVFAESKAGRRYPEAGEAHYLVLGKLQWQYAVWALRAVTGDSRHGVSPRGAEEHFAQALAYFEKYWPNSLMLRVRHLRIKSYLGRIGDRGAKLHEQLAQLEERYGLDLSRLLNMMTE